MEGCPFCAIARGEAPAHRVVDEGEAVAFLDREPATRGHTLVMPRDHHEDLLTAPEAVYRSVEDTVRSVAVAIEDVLEPVGFSTVSTTGTLVGTIDHVHVHLIPRYEDDDVRIGLSRSRLRDGDDLAAAIRSHDSVRR